MEQLKYKLSTALSVLFIILSFALNAQNIVKGAGVLYTNGVPSTTPRPQFDPEFAINLSNGYIYQWNRSRAAWNYIGSGIGKHNSNNAPVAVPQHSDPLFLINNLNQLYYYSGGWNCINCFVDTDNQNLSLSNDTLSIEDGNFVLLDTLNLQTLSIDKDTLTISEGNSIVLPGEVSDLNLIAPLPFSPTKGDIALKQVDVNGSKVFYAFDGINWVEGGMFLDTLNVATINIVDDAVTFDKTQNINTNRILGRYSSGSGNIQEIKVGGGLAINNDTLIATGVPSSIFYQFIRENGVVENQRSILSFINSNDIVFSATDDPGIENETEIRATIQLDAVDSTKVNNGSLSLRDLSQDGAANGDVIKWDGTKWVTNPDLNSGNTDLSFNGDTLRSSSGTDVRIISGTGISTTSNSSSITITNSSPDQVVSITGGGINSVSGTYPSFTVTGTEVDGSVTNEIQQIDTFSLSGNTLRVSLSSDNVPAKSVDLSPYVNVGTDLSFNLDTLRSSTGTDVRIIAGTGITTSSTSSGITINNSGDLSNTNELQNLSYNVATSALTISGGTGTAIPIFLGATGVDGERGLVPKPFAGEDTYFLRGDGQWWNIADQLLTNEGALTVGAGASNTSLIQSNTSGSTAVTIQAGTGLSISEAGNTITLTNSAPDQTVSITGAGINNVTGTYPSFTITGTEVDGSVTNEIQQIDTFSLSSNIVRISLSSDNVPAKTIDLSPYVNVGTDLSFNGDTLRSSTGTDVRVISGTGISTSSTASGITINNTAPDQTVVLNSGTGISASGTYPNFTITNTAPDQTVSISSGTGISVSGTYPSFTVTNTGDTNAGDDITGTGASGRVPYFTGAQTVSSTDSLVWDNTDKWFLVNAGKTQYDAALSVNGAGVFQSQRKDTVGAKLIILDAGYPRIRLGQRGSHFVDLESPSSGKITYKNDVNGQTFFDVSNSTSGARLNSITSGGVNGTTYSAFTLFANLYGISTSNPAFNLVTFRNSGAAIDVEKIAVYNGEDGRVVINGGGSGLLGVGTTSPSAKNHIKGNGTTSSTFTFRADNSQDSVIISARDDRRVGINTSSPQEELDVNGNIKLNTFAPTPATIAAYNSTNVLSKLLVGSGLTINGDTLKSTGGSGNTNLAFTGTSSPVTLTSSTGTDVTITAGTGVSLSATATDLTITNSSPDQTVSITNGGGISVSGTYPNFTLTATDDSATNEGSLTVGAGTGTTSLINSNTSGSTAVTIEAGTGIGISESGSTITLTNSGDLSNTNEIQNLSYTASTGAIGISGGGSGTTIPVMTSTVRGLVPDGDGTGTDEFLREDGSWAVIPDASTTVTGLVNQTAQSFSGLKQFTDHAVIGESGTSGILALTTGTVWEDVFITTGSGGAWTMTLPVNDGNSNQVLRTDGLGVTSWASIDSALITNGAISLLDIQQDGAASGEVIKWNGTRWITDTDNAGGVADGDKGDITVSSSGTVWDIDASAVGNSELASNAVDSTKIVNGGISLLDLQQDGAATGEVIKWNGTRWITDTDNSGGTPAWSSLTAPSGNLSLAHGANTTNFTFNSITTQDAFTLSSTSLTSGSIMKIESNGTAAISNQTGLEIALSGASSGSPITYGSTIVNSHTGGSSSANYGISSTAINAGENHAIRADAYGGSMNYGVYSAAVSSAGNEAWGVFSSATGDGTSYGVYASAGSSDNNYAIYADARNGDFDNYAIYTDLGDIRFGDLASAGNRIVGASSFGLLSVITPSTGLSLSGGNLTATDASVSNEGSLSVAAGGSNDSQITSNTSGSSAIVISGGSNVTVTESGNTITIASSGGSGVSVISPSNITVTQNNYNPTGWSTATHVFLTSSTEVGITGFQQGNDGEIKRITNRGSNNIYIPGNHPSSGASKRVNVSTDHVLRPKESIEMVYSGTDSLWYIVGDESKCSSCVEYSWSAASVTAGDNSEISQVAINSGTTTTAVVTSSGLPRPSLSLSTASLSNGGAAVGFPKTTNAIGYYDSTRVCFSAYLTLQDTSNATDAFIAGITLVPLVTSTAAAHENNSISISYTHSNNGGRWYGKTVSSTGTTTEVDLGIKMVDDRAYLLEICLDKNANEARFYINGVLKGVLTATMPSATTISGRAQIHKTAGTTARLLRVHSMKAYAE